MTPLAALVVDVETDPRVPTAPDPAHWRGFHAARAFVDELRAELRAVQREPVTFGWMLRMDPHMRATHQDPEWIGRVFRRELSALQSKGDELGLHTHMYRCTPEGRWLTDVADPEWAKTCILEATRAFQRCFGTPARFHSFGDRWLSEAALDVLEAQGVRLELTPEPGLTPSRKFVSCTELVGELPDYSRCPHDLWRPARHDLQCHDAVSGRDIYVLPVSTYKLPLYFEPGRRLQRVVQRALGEPEYADVATQGFQRVCLANREYVFRHSLHLLRRAYAPRTLHFVLRADRLNYARVRRRVRANLRWLLSGAAGVAPELVAPLRLLERVARTAQQPQPSAVG